MRFRRTQARRELLVSRFQASAFVLIGLHAVFQPLDRLVLDRQAACIVDGAVGIVSVLALQGQDLVFQPGVFRAQGLASACWHSSIRERGTIAHPETDEQQDAER